MNQGKLQGWDKIKYWWYRALGHSDTQARWQLREKPNQKVEPRKLKHRNCEQCQHLMLITDKECGRCGFSQQQPSWLLNLSHKYQLDAESVIPCIVALCLLGYLVQIKLGGTLWGGMGDPEASRRILIVGGVLPFSLGEYLSTKHAWRLFTYTCVHGNLMHIGFNLMALLQIGPLVARTFGFSRTLFIWVTSGASAILLPALIGPTGLTVGASGSVFGLIGVAMVFGHRIGTPQGLFIRNKMIEWTIFCTLFGLMMGGVAHSAHFGGLIGGGLLSFVLSPPGQNTKFINSLLLLVSSMMFIGWSLWSAWGVYQQVSPFG